MEKGSACDSSSTFLTLDTVRESLIRQEDTIIFSLIERSKYPINSPAYHESFDGISGSLVQYIVKETEAIHAKVGRYESPEEHPFFPDNLPHSIVPPHNYPQVLHPAAASINVNKTIWDIYFNQLLPMFAPEGDDGNYVPIIACDLQCLQALSRRIHYGKFVAEVKFRDAPGDYGPAISTQDRDALMKLLTFEHIEEMVKKRVEKKAMVFGQEVCLNGDDKKGNFKVDPSIVSHLYGEWHKFECQGNKFPSVGIPCCHIIAVMKYEHILQISQSCQLQRWMKIEKELMIQMSAPMVINAEHKLPDWVS